MLTGDVQGLFEGSESVVDIVINVNKPFLLYQFHYANVFKLLLFFFPFSFSCTVAPKPIIIIIMIISVFSIAAFTEIEFTKCFTIQRQENCNIRF